MRLGVFVLFAALTLAVVAGQNSLISSTEAESSEPAITACAVQGGDCWQPSLDSTPGTVLEHVVYTGACAETDLHMVRYIPSDSADGKPVVATWCA